jgi:hypothetical protein
MNNVHEIPRFNPLFIGANRCDIRLAVCFRGGFRSVLLRGDTGERWPVIVLSRKRPA